VPATAPSPPAAAAPPLRVAYVMSRFPKLTETFVLYEILAMDELGVDVEVYPLLRHRARVSHPEAERWTRRARFRPFASPAVLRANLWFLRHRPRAYLRTLAEVLRRTWGSANFFAGALATFPKVACFAREMEERGVAHVHAHFATHPALAAFVVNRLTGIPYSFTAHGSDLHVDRRMLDAKVEAAAFTVTVSEYNRRMIVAECGGRFADRVHVVHCGVDPDDFPPTERPERAGPCRIVCVASFEEVKGHAILLEACRILRERGVQFRCDLVGGGPLRRRVEAQVARTCLEGRVRLLGPLPRPAVLRLLRDSDVAVLASRPTRGGKREGIPVALMEAMASGLPVVASDLSGIPELVESGRTGILVPPADPRALAGALEALARDPPLRARLGSAARDDVLRRFDLRASARTLLGLVRAVAAPSPVLPGIDDATQPPLVVDARTAASRHPLRHRQGA
jgi:colanic acid/amylovoran biosynthesis glycosyltransferase